MNQTLFDMAEIQQAPQHPAKYTDALIPSFVDMLRGSKRILDPFGGTGKIFDLAWWMPNVEIQAVEIEPEWAALHPKTMLGDALALPWGADYFDAVCTSPTYGNRMADGLRMADWNYITYAQKLGRKLNSNNSGSLQWGPKYKAFHVGAWIEAKRVLQVGGRFILNIKDHIRDGERQYVTDWHIETLQSLNFKLIDHKQIEVPSMRQGQNSEARVPYESVILFRLEAK